jgi:large subunit ribosomal protein L30
MMAKKVSRKKVNSQEMKFEPKLMFAIRIRGSPGMNRKIMDTLSMLRMNKVNHGVLIWGEKSQLGMLNKCKDYIAYGEIDEKILVRLLRVRGRLKGNKPLTDENVKSLTEYKNIKEFASALHKGEVKYKPADIENIKPVFRLHPPRKGHRGSVKKHYGAGGTLGYVNNYINELVYKMI